MRIMTLNCNGIRAAARKGFFDWLPRQHADVVCLQETKAQAHQLDPAVFYPKGYHVFYHDAEKKGYSGVAIYSRHEPEQVTYGLGWEEIDAEARYLQVDFSNLSVVSLYMPSGTSGEARQEVKYQFMDRFMPHLRKLKRRKREVVICGDWNIAHKKIDLKNWRSNQKNSGFLPEERAWMDRLFGRAGWVDAFRVVNQEAEQYTWWSHRGRAWDNNTGWRLDYQVVTPGLKDAVVDASIYTAERFSDHAPLTLDYDFSIDG